MTSLGPFQPKLFCDSIIYFSIDLIGKKLSTYLKHPQQEMESGFLALMNGTLLRKEECTVPSAAGSLNVNHLGVSFSLEWDPNGVKHCLAFFLIRPARFWKPTWEKTNLLLNITSSSLILRNEKLLREWMQDSQKWLLKGFPFVIKRCILIAEPHQAWEIVECKREGLSWLHWMIRLNQEVHADTSGHD